MTLKTIAPRRGTDGGGSGHFGASRGSRIHKGQDYNVAPGSLVLSPVDGVATKHGYPYADDLSYRYVQIEDKNGDRHRFFYVTQHVSLYIPVKVGDVIGKAQDVTARYPELDMAPHVHYEIITAEGEYLDPETE